MFRTKKDVERHVADVLSKIDNENEKHLRGYAFARLFFQVKDYESAKKYLTGFLSIRDHHAASHKLMAQIYEATNNPENALQSYKRSLEIDSHQNDIVLKICELYCQLPVDHETARYWADRAEQLYPHHDIVFKLRECLVSAEGEPDRQELENLIASDLAAQPKNVDRRITLLRLYLDTERVKEAYNHATMIESKRMFPYSIDWYYLLGDIFEAYQEEYGEELDSQFYINYLTALDHLIYLTLAEPHAFILENGKKSSSLNDAAAVLLTFDQLLKKAVQKDIREGPWLYFINHMKGQLYFHMTSLLMKRAKMDQGNRKEAFRFSAGLAVVCYTFKPINLLHEVWFSELEDQKVFTNFFQQGSLRTSFIGHVLLSLCKDDKSSWVQKIKTEVCIPQVKERIYSRIFSSLFKKEKLSLSYFISDSAFEQSSLELPSEFALKDYDKSAYKLCPSSLHHLVWLELHRENARMDPYDTVSEIFKNLQYSNKNLSKGSCESLCVLDLESYLYATVYQSKLIIEKKNSIQNTRNDSLLSYPPDITDALCTTVQANWWKAAYGLYTNSIKEKLGEHRRNLQQGLEVIRGVGTHGLEVQLVIHLAHTFSTKADTLDKDCEKKTDKNKNKLTLDTVSALYFRATHYWNIALGILEKLASGKTLNVPKDPMFLHSGKVLSKNDIKAYQEEGQLFLAVRLMDSDKLNEAAEVLSKLSSPYGSYYLAVTMKKLASQEQKFTTARTALLNKAKASLLETMDRIKDDKTHPLNKEIYIDLGDIENELAFELSVGSENSCEDADEIDSYDDNSVQNMSYSLHENKSMVQSTPRLPSKFTTSRHNASKTASHYSPKKHFEPSPERLDAQIRALTLNQDTLMKSFFQQQQTLLETNKSIVEALQQNKDVLEQLKKQLEDLSLTANQKEKYVPKAVPKKQPIYLKGQGDEEEDYYDPASMLDYYEDGAEDYRTGYNFDRSSRMHDPASGASAALNYVVPPTLPPPGPPPAVNHFNYQYPPHGLVPTPPPAVAGRPTYYPPPGQGLPFNEGQQLPQFHFHVASAVGKPPPPPTMNTSLPQVVSGLPPPPVSVPPMSVPLPHSAVTPLSAPNPWSKPVSVPHAFQIPLPTSTVIMPVSSSVTVTTITQVTPSSAPPAVSSSQSQLRDLLQTPPVTRTITFGQLSTTTTPTSVNTSPSIFAGLNKTPEMPNERIRYDSETATSPDIDGHDLEKEVMGDFKPLIPLPAEIVVETGEENETVLFEDRAKLYRFIDQEWKERGIGVVKILHHKDSGRVRLLMRRDQVLKVCANHYITSNMEIHPLKNSDKAWTWVAQDFADETLRAEYFCIRFKTPEIAAVFKTAFEKAINISKKTEAKNVTSPKISTAVTTSPLSPKPFGAKFLPKPGSWTCPACYVNNPGDKLLCVCCDTKKPGSQTPVATSASPVTAPTSVTSSFGGKTLTSTTTSGGFKFGFSTTSSTASSTNVFSTVTTTTSSSTKSVFGGFTFTSNPVIQEAESPEVKDREILLVSTKAKNGPQVTKVTTPSPFTGFTFKPPSITTVASTTQSLSAASSSPFSGFSCKPSPVSFTTSSSQPSTNVTTTTTLASISISNIQSSMQNISPAFVFSKDSNKEKTATSEVKSSSDSVQSGFSSVPSDTSKSSGEFVFGVKPATQPPTFSFGLSGLSGKTSDTIGFKPAFSTTSNAPAIFGGATQKTTEKPAEISKDAPLFGGVSTKSDSQISSIFGGSQKTDVSSNAPVFGGSQTTDVSPNAPTFGGPLKSESAGSIFNKSVTNDENKPLFGGLTEKSEIPKSVTTPFGTIQKPEISSISSASSIISTSPAVFNFGASSDTKGETGPVEFRFGSPQKYEFNFSGVRPRSPTKTPKSPATPSDAEEEEENESFDADNIYFQPVIPLPPKVDVKTGEENEKTLFCKRAKLFRFFSGEWKERGIGDFKILFDEAGKKVRLLMRRDQVLKVCLNHYLTKDITFEKRGDKTLSWAATDFSENEPSPELFALRFKTSEFADECLAVIEDSLKSVEKQSSNADVSKIATSFSFKTDTHQKTESLFTPGSLSSRFGTSAQSSTETSSTSNAVSFSFKDTPSSSSFFNVGTTSSDSKVTDNKGFMFGIGSERNEAKSADTDGEIEVVYEAVASPDDVALAKKYQLPPTFYLYKNKPPCPGCIGCEDFVPPAKSTASETSVSDTAVTVTSDNTANIFAINNAPTSVSTIASQESKEQTSENTMFVSTGLSFADLASKSTFEGLSTTSQKKGFEGAGTPLFAKLNTSAEGDGDEDTVAPAPDIHFEPVIPLPELIDVKTGEEDETAVFVNRAKLFKFDTSTKEWKERGVGELKILKHNEKLRFRIILRRDQVHKIACNHCIAENMELSPLATSETALCWNALDYSGGEPEASQFAVRFKNKDILAQFKEKFNECKEILKKGEVRSSAESNVKDSTLVKEKSVKEIPTSETPVKENLTGNQNEHETSESETNEDDEESDNESLYEKRVSFEIAEGSEDFKPAGMGILKVIYDDSVYGYHVYVISDSGVCLCDHIIAIQTSLRTEKKKATWAAIDFSVDPPRRRRYRASFSSADALKEFNNIFEEGKDAALQSEIVEKTDYFFTPQGPQT